MKLFKYLGTVECPDCGKHVRPKGPFKIVARDSDGDAVKTGLCPECGCEAVLSR